MHFEDAKACDSRLCVRNIESSVSRQVQALMEGKTTADLNEEQSGKHMGGRNGCKSSRSLSEKLKIHCLFVFFGSPVLRRLCKEYNFISWKTRRTSWLANTRFALSNTKADHKRVRVK